MLPHPVGGCGVGAPSLPLTYWATLGTSFCSLWVSDRSPSRVWTRLQFVRVSMTARSYYNSDCVDNHRLLELIQPGLLTKSWQTSSLPS